MYVQGATIAIALLLLVPGVISITRWPAVITVCAKNIREMHVTMGQWLGRATSEGSEIATMDIGAIGYYSDRRIIDIRGLITPEVVPYVQGKGLTRKRSLSLLEFLRQRRPGYLVIFPELYPGLVDDASIFKPLAEVELKDNQIAITNWMVAYQCLWERGKQSSHQ